MAGNTRNIVESEKITSNMGAVDLGNIDLLVEQGFYSNRSDFIRTAIRSQLATHSSELKKLSSDMTVVGLARFCRADLEKMRDSGSRLKLRLVGALIIDSDVPADLARATFESVKVYGILRASAEVKALIAEELGWEARR
jgi:Arc/MetJ-type ribon-helix-helix transcriptional regulator